MPKRTKEEISVEKEKEKLRALRRGPELDRFLEGRKRTFVSYAQGARIYSMNYRIRRIVLVNTEIIEEYLERNGTGHFYCLYFGTVYLIELVVGISL